MGNVISYKNIYFAILVRDGLEISIKTIIICCLWKPVIFLPFPSVLTMQPEPPKSTNMFSSLWCFYLCNCEFIYVVHSLIFIEIPHIS